MVRTVSIHGLVNVSHLPSVPWKNGGGTTKEIAAFPPNSGMDNFIWRVSVADITKASAYSLFPGVDRTQVLIAGVSLNLQSQLGLSKQLQAFQPFSFVGEQDWLAKPVGECQMLNVMTSRADAISELELIRGNFKCMGAGAHYVLVVVQGEYLFADAPQRFVLGDVVRPELAFGEVLTLSASPDAVMVAIKFSLLNK